MDETMDVTLTKSFIEKTMKKANERAIARFADENSEDLLLYDDLPVEVTELGIREDHINLGINSEEFGFFTLEIPLDINDLATLIELAVKRLNKYKAAIEVLK